MSLNRVSWIAACALVAAALVGALLLERSSRTAARNEWDNTALRARLERVVPAHNDAFFVYVLENRTETDYRVTSSEVRILGRSRSTGEFIPKVSQHVSGEFPLLVPARRKVHFALIWTADHDVDPKHMDEFVRTLNLRSFVLFDNVHRYQLEFPAAD